METTDFNKQIELIMNGEKSLSYSSLRQFLESPRHFKKHITEKKTTEAMEQGKRFHMAVLEYDKFIEKYWFLDDTEKVKEIGGGNPRATKLYKEWKAEKETENTGKEMLLKDEYDIYISMKEALFSNGSTKDTMNGLEYREKFMEIEHDGFKISMKIDGIHPEMIIDLKKVADAKWKRIKWDIKDKHYDMQGGLYTYAEHKEKFSLYHIDPGCNITVVNLLPSTLEEGFNKFELALQKFTECAEQDLWDSSYEFWNGGYINF